ncbi:hypothetical protein KASHIRA_02600 [Serratia phage vB_SmaM-Kashira]|nr:hypothetical protein KASHIRA_02600 [Serratia phage vB_SmaM-Kashira]
MNNNERPTVMYAVYDTVLNEIPQMGHVLTPTQKAVFGTNRDAAYVVENCNLKHPGRFRVVPVEIFHVDNVEQPMQ